MHLVPESLIPYLVITLNCFVFWTLRQILNPILPRKIRLIVWEVIATVELCSGCAELGVVWAKHGNIGLALTLFSACVWWSFHFDDAEACPCGPIEDVILFKEPITSPNISFRLIGQILGGYLTARYTNSIWAFHLTEEHQHFHGSKCEAALQSTVVNAFFVELTITFISRIVALKTERMSNTNLVIMINSLTTVLLSLSAQDSSGGFFNPVLASALTLNCEGNDLFEHFIVYWVGSLIGGLMARYIHTTSLMRTDQKLRKKTD